jgi:hypothetical protein
MAAQLSARCAGVVVERTQYSKLYDYGSVVTFAAGAFNWRVAVGDRTQVSEYSAGQLRLASETTAQEMTWSRSAPVATDQLAAWFGSQFKGAPRSRTATAAGSGRDARYHRRLAQRDLGDAGL